jgi:hypothetical protein
MRDPPWLQDAALELVAMAVTSHQAAFGIPLMSGTNSILNPRLVAQELFVVDQAVLIHDDLEDPSLIYVNATALRLWGRRWDEMVGMPSRLTAEPAERQAREEALAMARRREAISDYRGIRVDSRGRRFQIESARLWTLRDRQGRAHGQAASFACWWWH